MNFHGYIILTTEDKDLQNYQLFPKFAYQTLQLIRRDCAESSNTLNKKGLYGLPEEPISVGSDITLLLMKNQTRLLEALQANAFGKRVQQVSFLV